MMKDFQGSDQSKKRKICGYNLFQKDWWKNNKNGIYLFTKAPREPAHEELYYLHTLIFY